MIFFSSFLIDLSYLNIEFEKFDWSSPLLMCIHFPIFTGFEIYTLGSLKFLCSSTMDTAVYLQIALLAYFCLIICHVARYDKNISICIYIEDRKKKETCILSNAHTSSYMIDVVSAPEKGLWTKRMEREKWKVRLIHQQTDFLTIAI